MNMIRLWIDYLLELYSAFEFEETNPPKKYINPSKKKDVHHNSERVNKPEINKKEMQIYETQTIESLKREERYRFSELIVTQCTCPNPRLSPGDDFDAASYIPEPLSPFLSCVCFFLLSIFSLFFYPCTSSTFACLHTFFLWGGRSGLSKFYCICSLFCRVDLFGRVEKICS